VGWSVGIGVAVPLGMTSGVAVLVEAAAVGDGVLVLAGEAVGVIDTAGDIVALGVPEAVDVDVDASVGVAVARAFEKVTGSEK
jgi:hypothetical protein